MKKRAILVAGGNGSRMGAAIPKQFLLLNGKPILWHTIQVFLESFDDMLLTVVLPMNSMDSGRQIISSFECKNRITVVEGGATRFESVKNGLKTVDTECIVFVHDGVRCLVTPTLIKHCYYQAIEKGNAVPAIAAVDSIRLIEGETNRMLNRENVQRIQTPQAFRSDILLSAFSQKYSPQFTDEATVVEAMGHEIFLIKGEDSNIKITQPTDLALATHILQKRQT